MNILNALLFQIVWFACVLGGTPWGLAGVGILLASCAWGGSFGTDLALAAGLAVLGWTLDTLWVATGVLDYGTAVAPVWIGLLWFGVALTVNHSLGLFRARPLLGAALAACAAPVCYLGGERLGAMTVPALAPLAAVMLAWGAIFYAVFSAAGRWRTA